MTVANTKFKVVVGEHDICDGVGAGSSEGGQALVASQIFEHPDYDSFDNDIAVLEVPSQQL